MRRICVGTLLAFGLCACGPQLRPHISSFDGRPVDPVTQDQTSTECGAKAQVASATIPYAYGSSGGLARALEQNEVCFYRMHG